MAVSIFRFSMKGKLKDYSTEGNYGGGYTPLPAGAYVCKIVKAYFGKDIERDDSIKFYLEVDVAEGTHKGYFSKSYNPGDKWNWRAVFQRKVQDEHNELTNSFKQLMQCIEKSNPEFKFTEDFEPEQVQGKLCGFSFGAFEKRNMNTNAIYTDTKIKFCATVQDVRDGKVKTPPPEVLGKKPETESVFSKVIESAEEVPDSDLPF